MHKANSCAKAIKNCYRPAFSKAIRPLKCYLGLGEVKTCYFSPRVYHIFQTIVVRWKIFKSCIHASSYSSYLFLFLFKSPTIRLYTFEDFLRTLFLIWRPVLIVDCMLYYTIYAGPYNLLHVLAKLSYSYSHKGHVPNGFKNL